MSIVVYACLISSEYLYLNSNQKLCEHMFVCLEVK